MHARRPVPKEHVIALELSLEARNTQIEALDRQVQDLQGQLGAFKVQLSLWEQFVGDVARAGPSQRDVMLASFHGEDTASEHVASPAPTLIKSEPVSTPPPMSQIPQHHSPGAWPRSNGQMRVRGAGLSLFYGPTSFQITGAVEPQNTHRTRRNNSTIAEGDSLHCLLAPQSETCRRLMSLFFLRLYPYHMHFYREFFLRDLESGGPYYSDLLMYAICSVAALVSKDATMRQFSEVFAQRAQELLYNGGMDSPDITVLQGLLLLSQREIGQGNGSKGWLFAGKHRRREGGRGEENP